MKWLLIFLVSAGNHETIGAFPSWEACHKEAQFQLEQYKASSWHARFPKWACVMKPEQVNESSDEA